MALPTLSFTSHLFVSPPTNSFTCSSSSSFSLSNLSPSLPWRRCSQRCASLPDVCAPDVPFIVDESALIVNEAVSEEEFWAAACLRVRTFTEFKQEFSDIEDHKRYLADREFTALKKRVAGEREGFRTVSCINASLPLSHLLSLSEDLCAVCKGIGADFLRAYMSNVCVAEELHRNGLGYALISKAKSVAEEWGVTNLYVHVAVDNEPAKNLYMKSGFIYEKHEPEWRARSMKRPQRILLWFGLPDPYNL